MPSRFKHNCLIVDTMCKLEMKHLLPCNTCAKWTKRHEESVKILRLPRIMRRNGSWIACLNSHCYRAKVHLVDMAQRLVQIRPSVSLPSGEWLNPFMLKAWPIPSKITSIDQNGLSIWFSTCFCTYYSTSYNYFLQYVHSRHQH